MARFSAGLLLILAILSACASGPPQPVQSTAGPGWSLAGMRETGAASPGIAVDASDVELYHLAITANGHGYGCGMPFFVGFKVAEHTSLPRLTGPPRAASA